MEKFKKALHYLIHGDYFDSVLERIYAIALTLLIFIGIGYFFIYKPIFLFYLLIGGMLVMGWFMTYLFFPDLHNQFHSMIRSVIRFIQKIFGR